MKPTYDDTRQHLLDTGHRMMAEKGFTSVGLNEILQTAGVPKGSFYHYFKSKELYGQALLADYFVGYLADMERRLTLPGLTAYERLMDYWLGWQNRCTLEGHADTRSRVSDAMRAMDQGGVRGVDLAVLEQTREGQRFVLNLDHDCAE